MRAHVYVTAEAGTAIRKLEVKAAVEVVEAAAPQVVAEEEQAPGTPVGR